jgi:hypothetical protein
MFIVLLTAFIEKCALTTWTNIQILVFKREDEKKPKTSKPHTSKFCRVDKTPHLKIL